MSLRLAGNPVADDEEKLAQLAEARVNNMTRTTLTLGKWLGVYEFEIEDALQILRFIIGLPSVIDECEVAKLAARRVTEVGDPTLDDALAILRGVIGLD